jgi:hypothetical protein
MQFNVIIEHDQDDFYAYIMAASAKETRLKKHLEVLELSRLTAQKGSHCVYRKDGSFRTTKEKYCIRKLSGSCLISFDAGATRTA